MFGDEIYSYCMENAQQHIKSGKLIIKDNILKLTKEGIFISDGIMSDLMIV
jgi:oxygen-independent coproporphyrinogen-3 oxidase